MMGISDGERALATRFNPLWRRLARSLSGICEDCGQERLLSVFDFISGDQKVCMSCLMTTAALIPLVRLLFSRLGIRHEATRLLLGDPLMRKCMLSVVTPRSAFLTELCSDLTN